MSDAFSDDEEFEAAAAEFVSKKKTVSINWRCLQVHPDQAQNPVLNLITETPYQINDDLKVDFSPSSDVGILYLSLKYYNYRPIYIEERISSLPKDKFRVIVVLVLVDTKPADLPCRTLSVLCTKMGVTLIVGFSLDETSSYLENFKRLENKSIDWLRPKIEEEERLSKMVGHARGANSTDARNLMHKFGSVKAIVSSSEKEIESVDGVGKLKAKRLFDLFNTPFKK